MYIKWVFSLPSLAFLIGRHLPASGVVKGGHLAAAEQLALEDDAGLEDDPEERNGTSLAWG